LSCHLKENALEKETISKVREQLFSLIYPVGSGNRFPTGDSKSCHFTFETASNFLYAKD